MSNPTPNQAPNSPPQHSDALQWTRTLLESRRSTLPKRLRTAFDVWHEKGVTTVIAGAIGCGVFRWKGEDSARALRLALESTPWRGRLILAMPDPNLGVTFRLALDSLAG